MTPSPPDLPAVVLPRRIGAHMSTTGGLQNAITSGRDVGCDVVQVFTKSPQQWRARAIPDTEKAAFWEAQLETGIRAVVSHDSYLINPATDREDLLQRSREALVDELQRCADLGIPNVVMHLGARGEATEEEALERLRDSVKYILERAPDDGPTLLLETMAGQGTTLGASFDELGYVLREVDAGDRLGVCLDTCHIFVAGHDMRSAAAYAETMAAFDAAIGLDRIKIIHANDSKKGLGSRVDRHENIGQGEIGIAAFEHLLRDERLAAVPVVLETPKKDDMDPANLAALRGAAGLDASG